MKFEESIEINADAATVFNVLTDVSEWATWDPETESAELDGDFEVGTSGTIKPKGAPLSKMIITEVTEDKSCTIQSGLPLCKMDFIHTISPSENGVMVGNGVVFSGLLAPVFGRLIGKGIHKSLPGTLQGLKQHIEMQS